MGILHNIELHEESVKYLNEVFNQYEEIKYDSNLIIINPLVHLYGTHDTRTVDGELNGYNDALFITIKIYDKETMQFMQIHNRDGLDFYNNKNVHIQQIKVFKDGSTLIQLTGNYKFGNCQSVDVWSVNGYDLEAFRY
ncbi:hypothetical protein ACQKNX_07800 [Lysinibacillus sp. NPDC093712]|uniref:hypothetical protein n=1 Tax=Lysinibacillus sp. NPDC093712 TaxID=3390579 RepID=UPI003D0883EE